jgi:hypothetical protein
MKAEWKLMVKVKANQLIKMMTPQEKQIIVELSLLKSNKPAMRNFLLLIAFLSSINLCAQNDKIPSRSEMQVQMKKAMTDAKKQREDIRNQIADAKAKNEDPESIKQLENQLSSLDMMIGMLDKTSIPDGTRPKTLALSKSTEPVLASPFIPIENLKRPFQIPKKANATDKLLWYQGKKITPTTLITPAGVAVQYNSKTHTGIYEPRKPDTTYYGFVQMLSQIPQMKSSYAAMMTGMMNSFFMYPEIKDAYDEYDILNNRYYELAKNAITINLPRTPPTQSIPSMIEDLEVYVNNLPNVKQILPPPKRPNDLCLCATPGSRARYENELRAWAKKYFAEEMEVLERIQNIDGAIEDLRSYNVKVSQSFDEKEYVEWVFKRAIYKVDMILQEYNSSSVETVLLEDALIYGKKILEHWLSEFVFDDFADPQTDASFANLIDGIKKAIFSSKFADYIFIQKNKKNFNAVFDYGFYMNHEFNKKIVTLPYIINDNFMKWMDGFKDFNRFTLKIKIDFIYKVVEKENDGKETPVTIADGTIESDNIIVSLARHKCNWELHITDVNYRNMKTNGEEFRIPMKVTGGAKLYLKPPLGSKPYIGPSDIGLIFPNFNINFCSSGSTALMQNLTYSAADYKKHANDDLARTYSTDLLQYANEIFLSAMGTEVNASQVIKSAVDMMNMNNSQSPQLPSGTPAALAQLVTEYDMHQKQYDLQYNLSHVTQNAKTEIQLTKSPNSTPDLVFDAPVEMADKNNKDRKVGMYIEHGGVTITLRHTPK